MQCEGKWLVWPSWRAREDIFLTSITWFRRMSPWSNTDTISKQSETPWARKGESSLSTSTTVRRLRQRGLSRSSHLCKPTAADATGEITLDEYYRSAASAARFVEIVTPVQTDCCRSNG